MRTKEKYTKKESGYMLNEKICKLREELNQSILTIQDYSITYQLSVELDELIAMYYRESTVINKSQGINQKLLSNA